MFQNSMSGMQDDCGCNDYRLSSASTGIATIATASPSLSSVTNGTLVLTGASDGTVIKSIIIKAAGPVTAGMVRLFICKSDLSIVSLYKEIPIPTSPALDATPTPPPILPTFEFMLTGDLKLASGVKLYASTQNAEAFNVIAEGLDWTYPGTLPDTCCNFRQEFAVTGLGVISTANSNTGGTGNILSVFAAPGSTNGSVIKSITIKALQSTNLGMIRIYISPDGVTYTLIQEVCVPQTSQGGLEPSFKHVIDMNYNLKAGYVIGASTQIGQGFAITVEGTSWSYPIS